MQTYRLSGGEENRQAAVDHLEQALAYWDEVIAITRPIYEHMRLTHYNHNFFVEKGENWFHWGLIRGAVARDVAIGSGVKIDECILPPPFER